MKPRNTGRVASWRFLFLIVVILFFVGFLALAAAHQYKDHDLTTHLLRDFGIACLISALVTILYEAYIRHRFDIEKIDTLLNTVYGSSIPLEVWNNIRDTLLSRPVLREGAAFHLRIKQHPTRSDAAILEVQFEYTLVRLSPHEYRITHYLDSHINDEATNVPRFVSASVGTRSFAIDSPGPWQTETEQAWVDRKGCLTLRLDRDKNAPPQPVAVRRLEIRSVPGSYFFVMTEVTTGIRIYLEECPPHMDVEISLWPPVPDIALGKARYAMLPRVFLPGHALEFKLLRAYGVTESRYSAAGADDDSGNHSG